MAIEFRCSQCNQLLRVPDNSAGKNARCPKCQALMRVPAASTPAVSGEATAPPPASALDGPRFGDAAPGAATEQWPAASFSVAPAPPAPESDAPFSFLAPPSGSSASPAFNATPSTPANPFGDAATSTSSGDSPFASANPFGGTSPFGGASGAPNPYATPAPLHTPYNPIVPQSGLPWEVKRQTFGCWFETLGLIVGSPTRAFTIMRKRGGLWAPILFNIYGFGMPMAAVIMLVIPLIVLLGLAGDADNLAFGLGGAAGMIVLFLLLAVAYVLIRATALTFFLAGIWHLFLLMCGGAKHGYETTFQVTSYISGSLAWVGFIPYIGGLIQMIWTAALTIIGLSRAHETTTGKAAFAVLMPIALYIALCIGIVAIFVLGPEFLEILN